MNKHKPDINDYATALGIIHKQQVEIAALKAQLAAAEKQIVRCKVFRERLHSYRNGYIEWSRVMDAQRDLIEEALAAPEI